MIGRLYNKARKERQREEERERLRPSEEISRERDAAYCAWLRLMETDAPWRNTRRVKCACGNTARFDIPKLPATFRCVKCGGRQTVIG